MPRSTVRHQAHGAQTHGLTKPPWMRMATDAIAARVANTRICPSLRSSGGQSSCRTRIHVIAGHDETRHERREAFERCAQSQQRTLQAAPSMRTPMRAAGAGGCDGAKGHCASRGRSRQSVCHSACRAIGGSVWRGSEHTAFYYAALRARAAFESSAVHPSQRRFLDAQHACWSPALGALILSASVNAHLKPIAPGGF